MKQAAIKNQTYRQLYQVVWVLQVTYNLSILKFQNKILTIKAKYYVVEPYYMEGSTLNSKRVLLSF